MSEKTRILIVDDNQSIHEDLKQVLIGGSVVSGDPEMKALENDLFSDPDTTESIWYESDTCYEIDDAYQGEEGIAMVKQAEIQGRAYSLVFMDVRMPPGIDGIKTISKIWEDYPNIEMIICTAYSDYTLDNIVKTLGSTEHLFFMKKPFDSLYVKQTVMTLTDRLELCKKNKEYADKIVKEVKERKAQLKNMEEYIEKIRKETEALIIAKNDFMATVSSDIREPLYGMIGVTDILLDTELDDEQMGIANRIKTSGSSVLTIIDDILDNSKTKNKKIDLEEIEFNLRTSVENVADLVSVIAHGKGMEVAVIIFSDVPEILVGDPLLLRQILLSFANNVVKLTDSGEVVISVYTSPAKLSKDESQSKDKRVKIRFEILGTGPEISTENQEKLSELFSESSAVNQVDRKSVVLTNSKKIVELMKGSIGFEEVKGKISKVWFDAQLEIAELSGYEYNGTSTTITGTRCLIISDNPTTSKILTLYINHWGGKCSEASNIKNAMDKLYTAMEIVPFDMVIVDLKKGALDAFKYIALEIRKEVRFKNLHLICISAMAKRGDAKILKKCGYIAFLTKPIKQGHLHNCILMIKDAAEDRSVVEQTDIITKHVVDEFVSDRYRALIVDDSLVNQKVLVKLLSKIAIRCDVAQSGTEAVQAFLKKNYDMIFMDCSMPKMDGYEATKRIREKERSTDKPVPIMAITADSRIMNRERCLAAGMDEFITKPYDIHKIASTIRECFKPDNKI